MPVLRYTMVYGTDILWFYFNIHIFRKQSNSGDRSNLFLKNKIFSYVKLKIAGQMEKMVLRGRFNYGKNHRWAGVLF
jgi:hypothetical protein